jgi:beta-1,4-N-acetylglucosaminyltransferase
MIFLTIGTQFPFDRLVRAVDDAVATSIIEQPVYAQVGKTKFTPKNIEYVEVIDKCTFDKKVAEADYIISHAGTGCITMALENAKPLLVMPRMKKYKEHVNDHQVATARKFEELGYLLVANDVEDLPDAIRRLKTFVPKQRKVNPKPVIDRIHLFLNSLQN